MENKIMNAEIWLWRGYGTQAKRFARWQFAHVPKVKESINFEKITYIVERVIYDCDINQIRIHIH